MAITLISHVDVPSGGVSSINFMSVGSIPNTYTDLLLVFSTRSSQAGYSFDDIALRFNGDSGANYEQHVLRSRDSVTAAFSGTATRIDIYGSPAGSATPGVFGAGQAYIVNYAGNTHKAVMTQGFSETNNANSVQGGIVAGKWKNVNPITSISIFSLNGWTLLQYSSATLYGVTAGSDGTTTVS